MSANSSELMIDLGPRQGLFGNVPMSTPESIEIIEEKKPEIILQTDNWDDLTRRVLITVNAYGRHDLARAAAAINITKLQLVEILNRPEVSEALESRQIPCWTKAELVAKLCIEAEKGRSSADRILAITKLMEFRSMSLPEGGSRNFTRVISRFKR